MSARFIIYALVDPRDGAWRYIGKSSSGLIRPGRHAREAELGRHGYKNNWIRSLQREGIVYGIETLECVEGSSFLSSAEIEWIAAARSVGVALTNATGGGEGLLGWHHSEEFKQARSGDLSWARRNPGAMPRGDKNGARLHPESLPRGNDHWSRRLPERVMRGDKWTRAMAGKMKVGDAHSKSKLTASLVAELRAIASPNYCQLARQHGVSAVAMRAAIIGKSWKSVGGAKC